MVLALHFGPVRSELAGPEPMNSLFFCFAASLTASATAELGTSRMTSTLSTSNHELAMLDPISGLF